MELQPDGRVFLTLPADGENPAVSLGSGMDYYFRLTNIYDDSNEHNRLVITNENGNVIDGGELDFTCELSFSTIYATVWLSKDRTGASNTQKDDTGDALDIVFDVTPTSTGNMSDTEYWDMVIRNTNNVPCKFVVYRSADNGDTWERVTQLNTESRIGIDGSEIAGEANIYGGNMLSVSLNHFKSSAYINTTGNEEYETVKDGLDRNYKYAIHFTEVNGNRERKTWTSTIKLEIRLVAGERGNLRRLADNPYTLDANYKTFVDEDKTLSEISAVRSGTGTVTYLEVDKEFTDDRPPAFYGSYPTFTATSSTITMNIALDRSGKVYYVAAPAGELEKTERGDYVLASEPTIPTRSTADINAKNDGRENSDVDAANRTYIPEKGSDLQDEDLKKQIQFADDGRSDEERKYAAPAFGSVFAGSYNDPDGIIKKGSVEYTTYTRTERITGLKPETWYYVYMVLQSDSNKLDEVVQIYRVQTAEAEPPTIAISRTNSQGVTTVNMKVYEGGTSNSIAHPDPELYYALVRKEKLPTWLNGVYYVWTDDLKNSEDTENEAEVGPFESKAEAEAKAKNNSDVMTVFEAMLSKPGSSGKSTFDLYASEALREKVRLYISEATEDNQRDDSFMPGGPIYENEAEFNCEDLSQQGQYVMLVCAKHREKGKTEANSYGFAAAQGLYKPDPEPPEFLSFNNNPLGDKTEIWVDSVNDGGFTRIITSGGTKNWLNDSWNAKNEMSSYLFSGTLTLTFRRAIYVYDEDDVLKQVVNKLPWAETDTDEEGNKIKFDPNRHANPDTEISILKAISSSTEFTVGKVGQGNGTTFYLAFTDQRNISLSMLELYNGGGFVKSNKMLSITFDKSVTKGQLNVYQGYDNGYGISDTLNPVFKVSWR